ncbi:MAG: YgfZ/GcvT domain-containing protein [Phycisphaerales bacterium JB059]
MTPHAPLLPLHQRRDALIAPYGDADDAPPVVQTFGHLDLEYAALRKHAVLFDAPHRATLSLTGEDRLPFLDAMLTQRVRDLAPADVRDAFWLNRKGRIVADLRITHLPDRTLLDLDTLAARQTAESLESFIFTEDVTITDRSDELSRLWLLGPTAPLLLDAAADPAPQDLPDRRAFETRIADVPTPITRADLGPIPAFELTLPLAHASTLYNRLLELGEPPAPEPGAPQPDTLPARVRLRPTGWHAINIARIESGIPMFNLDFATANLPAETGLLEQRVDFKKGCYLGQEVVTRMHALGHPKQTLVALRIETTDDEPAPPQAGTGAELFTPDNPDKPVGAITSSTISPMCSGASIALAMVRWGAHEPGGRLHLTAEGRHATATIQPTLTFYPAPA